VVCSSPLVAFTSVTCLSSAGTHLYHPAIREPLSSLGRQLGASANNRSRSTRRSALPAVVVPGFSEVAKNVSNITHLRDAPSPQTVMLQTLREEGTSRDQIVSVMVEQIGKQAAGEKQGRKPWTLREVGGKTLWDWLQLLIVPVVLSLITVAFAWQQDTRQQRIENQRAEAERELAEQRAQDEALQAYLDQMSTLVLEKDLLKARGNPSSEVITLARARTLTVLERLDPSRKTQVARYLMEAKLVRGAVEFPRPKTITSIPPVISLRRANLQGADLSERRAELSESDPRGSLVVTNLVAADLEDADLKDVDLTGANLEGAEGVTNEVLEQQAASLEAATMPNGQKYEDWIKSKGRGEDG
jgi:hypothetical protein